MTILWEFRKLQGELISLRSSTQRENLLSLRLQPAKGSNLILFSDALLKAVNRLHRQKAPCPANLDSSEGQPSLRDCSRLRFILDHFTASAVRAFSMIDSAKNDRWV